MSMSGYTKLFSTIISSTIWREPKETKVLWITMLAMANKDGIVESSLPGLAHLAGLTIPETEIGIAVLSSPDFHSRTQDYEGRRIEPIDGGWFLINHAKYRAMMNADDRREYLRQKQAEYRMRKQLSPVVSDTATPSTHAEAYSEAEAIYLIYPKKVGKQDALKAIKNALKTKTADQLKESVLAYAKAVLTWPEDQKKYIPLPATWFNGGRYDDDRSTWGLVEEPKSAARKVVFATLEPGERPEGDI